MPRPSIFTRRLLLERGLGLIGVGAALPHFLVRTTLAGASPKSDERILVVLQLEGGHDGLSAVVPYADDNYAKARRSTRVAADQVLRLDDYLGFHPALARMRQLYDQQELSIVQGVGYPNPNRSHFRSMDIWHSADSTGLATRYGWLGRYADRAFPGVSDPTLAMMIGGEQAPLALRGQSHGALCLQRPEGLRWTADQRLAKSYQKMNKLAERHAEDGLNFVVRTALDTDEAAQTVLSVARRGRGAAYPSTPLAASLEMVANLIAGGMNTRVYYVVQRGFDTHAGQRQRHDRLMTELDGAIGAFQRDLAQQRNGQRVLTLAFSEFGRRVEENASGGTDHGAAGPVFLFSPAVVPGVVGQHPSLAASELDRGDLAFAVDFRSVYAAVLERWLGVPHGAVLDEAFAPLECIRA
jgi:uncharacterized protein (DUF1501 family)